MAVSDRSRRANRGAEKRLSIPELPQASCFSKLHILSAFPSFKKTRSVQEEKDETQKEDNPCSGHAHGSGGSDRLCCRNAVRIVRADLTDRPAANGRADSAYKPRHGGCRRGNARSNTPARRGQRRGHRCARRGRQGSFCRLRRQEKHWGGRRKANPWRKRAARAGAFL